jgi:hypothetical protein
MSNETKQTAVDFIIAEITHPRWMTLTECELLKIYEQAKEMEKEQIIDAFSMGIGNANRMEATKDAEQWHNETYGGNK